VYSPTTGRCTSSRAHRPSWNHPAASRKPNPGILVRNVVATGCSGSSSSNPRESVHTSLLRIVASSRCAPLVAAASASPIREPPPPPPAPAPLLPPRTATATATAPKIAATARSERSTEACRRDQLDCSDDDDPPSPSSSSLLRDAAAFVVVESRRCASSADMTDGTRPNALASAPRAVD
jgi:hypothetical protein